MSNFSSVSDDLLYNIMSRLPAKSFAAAACVNHLWNRISDLILSRPQFSSGLSLTPLHEDAVNEALEMALSKPIRPHFAIAFVGLRFSIENVHEQITSIIGRNAILITSASVGIIGVDSTTKELEEVKWELPDDNVPDEHIYRGITVVIGFVPGLKINVVPLLRTNTVPQVTMIDKFLSDVREFTVSASGITNPDPVGMILFGDHCNNLKPTLAVIDTQLSSDTVMMGDLHTNFVCTHDSINNLDMTRYSLDAIALVFARDNDNTEVEIGFHVGISTGILPMGSELEIMGVLEFGEIFSGLVARTVGELVMPVYASGLVSAFPTLIDDEYYFLYIGVEKQIIQQEGRMPVKYQEFYEVIDIQDSMFIVAGRGVNPGDICMLYHSDKKTAVDWNESVYYRFNDLVESPPHRVFGETVWSEERFKEKVFGGIVFASSTRGERFFGESMVDCVPFCGNFPKVPFGGTFCYQPIGRSPVLVDDDDDDLQICEEDRFNMQVFNAVHLVMTYRKTS